MKEEFKARRSALCGRVCWLLISQAQYGFGAAGLRSRCWDTRPCIGTGERVNGTTTDSEGRSRDTEEPGVKALLAWICGGAGEVTRRLYPNAHSSLEKGTAAISCHSGQYIQ
jgi:hypothetical protein